VVVVGGAGFGSMLLDRTSSELFCDGSGAGVEASGLVASTEAGVDALADCAAFAAAAA
jgi:hypothetical protein